METRRAIPVLIAATVALLAGGCGGGPGGDGDGRQLRPEAAAEPGSPSPGAAGRRAWARRADEVCLATDRAIARAELQEFGRPGPDEPGPTTAERQRFHDEVVFPARRDELELLGKLDPPAELESEAESWLAAFREGVAVLARDLVVIRDPGAVETAFDDAIGLAGELGLIHCGDAEPGAAGD